MDAKQAELEKKLSEILKQAADVACEIQAVKQGAGDAALGPNRNPGPRSGTAKKSHGSSRPSRRSGSRATGRSDCPDCGQSCRVEVNKREFQSMDGPVELIETIAHCHRCRRSFFPHREALGLAPRESTPGFKRQMIVLNTETHSLQRASIVMKRVVRLDAQPTRPNPPPTLTTRTTSRLRPTAPDMPPLPGIPDIIKWASCQGERSCHPSLEEVGMQPPGMS